MRRHSIPSHSILVLMLVLCGSPAVVAAASSWPGMLGPGYDGAVRDASLVKAGDKMAMAVGWKRSLGSGYSVLAAGDGRVFAMFSAGDGTFAAGFDQKTGNELWRHRIEEFHRGHDGSHDGPISSPALGAGRLFGLSPRGILFAVEAATGKSVWSKNIAEELGAKAPFFGFGSSPIVVDGMLVLEIGAGEGKAIAGFRPEDGKLVWSVGNDEINYQSPVAAVIGGRTQVVAAGNKTLWGLEPATGKVLWSHEHQGDGGGGEKLIAVPSGDGRFLLVNKHDSSTMIRVVPGEGGAYKIEELWTKNSIKGSYVIPVYHDGHIYGSTGVILTCVDAATGETRWRSREGGDGWVTLVGGHLVVLTKQGILHIVEASPAGYQELGRMNLFDEHAWSAVAYAGGHLFARSMGHLARVDLNAQAPPPPPVMTADAWISGTGFGRLLAEVEASADRAGAVDRYLKKQTSYPIIEADGAVHFVYRGKAADVAIVGDMLGESREEPMRRLAGTDVFHYSTRLKPDAAVTYGYIVDYDKAAPDPLNPSTASGLFGDVSLLEMPDRRKARAVAPAEEARQGRLETLEITSRVGGAEKKRTAQIYLPAGYDARPDARYPTLYIHDGKRALERGDMKNALDSLIGTQVEPLIGVFVFADNQGEFWQPDPYVEMVATELMPEIDRKYRTINSRDARASAGGGGGASLALACVVKHPDLFRGLGSLSAFVISRRDYEQRLPDAGTRPFVIFLKWGTYDMRSTAEAWSIVRGNGELWDLLREKGHRPSGGEATEGYGWSFWRDHVTEMVTTLFPRKPA